MDFLKQVRYELQGLISRTAQNTNSARVKTNDYKNNVKNELKVFLQNTGKEVEDKRKKLFDTVNFLETTGRDTFQTRLPQRVATIRNEIKEFSQPKIDIFKQELQNTMGDWGRKMQKFPDTSVTVPSYFSNPVTDTATRFVTGIPGSMVQSYGRTLEQLSTPEGRAEVAPGAFLERTRQQGVGLRTLNDPSVETALNVTDFIPGLGFVGLGTKGLGKTAGREILEAAAEKEAVEFAAEKGTQKAATKYAFNINKPKLGISKEGTKVLDDLVTNAQPILEKIKGKPLTETEVVKASQKAAVFDHIIGRDQTKEFATRLTATRNKLSKKLNNKTVDRETLDLIETVSSLAADTGRRLKAFDIIPEGKTLKETVLNEVQALGATSDEILAAAKGVDWDNQVQVAQFFRQFQPAKLVDKLDELRYTSMLSSPQTHIVNVFSNFLNTAVVTPIEKTLTGGLDWTKHILTGSERKYFIRQGVDYSSGYWRKLPEAWGMAKKVAKGEVAVGRPELRFLAADPSGKHSLVIRLLEAGDQFFSTMTKGGLEAAGATKSQAAQEAEYRLFRSQIDPSGKLGGNAVLRAFDAFTSWASGLRRVPGGKYILPFIQTPANIAKAGLEYSPLGLATVPGAKEPLIQLSKTIIGSTVFVSAYSMAEKGLVTWAPPKGEKQRSEFYAAGLQPYAIKIDDRWYSYTKIGPLAYPIAMAAAWHDAVKRGDETNLQKAGASLLGFMQFFSDQTYVQGIGDIIGAISGDKFDQQRMLSNIPSQFIPYRGFISWMNRYFLDKTYRKGEGIFGSIATQLPILSQTQPAYEDPSGQPSMRQFPRLNAFSPAKVTQEDAHWKNVFDIHEKKLQKERMLEATKKAIKAGGKPQPFEAKAADATDPLAKAHQKQQSDSDKLSLTKDILGTYGDTESIKKALAENNLGTYEEANLRIGKSLGVADGARPDYLKDILKGRKGADYVGVFNFLVQKKLLSDDVITYWLDNGEIDEATADELKLMRKKALGKKTGKKLSLPKPKKITLPKPPTLTTPKIKSMLEIQSADYRVQKPNLSIPKFEVGQGLKVQKGPSLSVSNLPMPSGGIR